MTPPSARGGAPSAAPDTAREIRLPVYRDARGAFAELWRSATPVPGMPAATFVQDNVSVSRAGVLRGLHWQQPPFAQGKLVLCLRGRIFDAVVDLRPSSPGYGRATTFRVEGLDGATAADAGAGPAEVRAIWVPPGYAHGFLALEEGSIVAYKVTRGWNREAERTLRHDDPALRIAWPLPEVGDAAVVNDKDRAGMTFAEYAAAPATDWETSA